METGKVSDHTNSREYVDKRKKRQSMPPITASSLVFPTIFKQILFESTYVSLLDGVKMGAVGDYKFLNAKIHD